MGQHYNQAAYIGKYFGITNFKSNKNRYNEVPLIKIKDIIDLKSNNSVPSQEDLKNLLISRPADSIYSGKFLSKEIEDKYQIGILENDYIKKLENNDIKNCFNKNDSLCRIALDYYALHEARNFQNFLILKKDIKLSMQNNIKVNDIFEKINFLNNYNTKNQKNIIKNCLEDIKNDYKLLDTKTKELFNLIYPLLWKKNQIRFTKYKWLVLELETGIGLPNNLVLDMKNPFYINYKQIYSYQWLPFEMQKIIDNGIFIFLDNKTIALGVLPNVDNNILLTNLTNENYNQLHRFLSVICISHSYKHIIITDENQLNFLASAFTLDFSNIVKQLEHTENILHITND